LAWDNLLPDARIEPAAARASDRASPDSRLPAAPVKACGSGVTRESQLAKVSSPESVVRYLIILARMLLYGAIRQIETDGLGANC